MGKRYTRSEADALIIRQRSSGQSQSAFCAAQGLKLATFQWWLKRFRGSNREGFVRLAPTEATVRSCSTLRLHLPDGLRLEWQGNPSAQSVAAVIAALRTSA